MPDVKLTGNIGRRHDDDKGLLFQVYPGFEVALLQPELIPLSLNPHRLIGFGHVKLSFWCFCHAYLSSNYLTTSPP
ncbi:hypothetical protein ES703_115741 [subsurface metagenome]